MQMDNNLENKLNELKKAYIQKLGDVLPIFEKVLADLPKINLDELYSQIHKISGTSGMYGFKELSQFSSEFEFKLKEMKKNDNINVELINEKLSKYKFIIENLLKEGK